MAPQAFWLLFLALPITAMFFYRRRAVRMRVPSIDHWRRVGQPRSTSALGKRLSHLRTLLAALLVLTLLVTALAGPYRPVATHHELILVVDGQLSMQTIEGDSETRMDMARQQAIAAVKDAPPDTLFTLVRAGSQPEVQLARSDDRAQAISAIQALEADDAEGQLGAAIELAASFTTVGRQTRLLAFSSPAGDDPPEIETLPARLELRRIGRPQGNAGIVGLDWAAASDSLRVTLRANGPAPSDARVTLTAVEPDGRLGNVLGRQAVVFDSGRAMATLSAAALAPGAPFHVRLTPDDALRLDNEAWGVRPRRHTIRILLVSSGNPFLMAALNADPDAEVTSVAPAAWTPEPPADVMIFDRVLVPSRNLCPGRFVFFGCPDPFGWTQLVPEARRPDLEPTNWPGDHPALADVDLATWRVAESAGLQANVPAESLVSAGDTPLLFLVRQFVRQTGPDDRPGADAVGLFFNFGLSDSNLALRPTFPVLVWNVLNHVLERDETQTAATLKTGTPLERSRYRFAEATLKDPNGREIRRLSSGDRWRWTATQRQGLYRLRSPAGEDWVAFNALPSRFDSPATPATTRPDTAQPMSAGLWSSLAGYARQPWRLLLIAGVVLLALEWLLFHLRVLRL